jgi:hypothetical protein
MLGVDESMLGAHETFHTATATATATVTGLSMPPGGRPSQSQSEAQAGSEVVKVVDLWSCYVKLNSTAEGHFTTFMLYAVYWVRNKKQSKLSSLLSLSQQYMCGVI